MTVDPILISDFQSLPSPTAPGFLELLPLLFRETGHGGQLNRRNCGLVELWGLEWGFKVGCLWRDSTGSLSNPVWFVYLTNNLGVPERANA